MGFFIGIACPWLLIAALLLWSHRRGEDPTTGQWRAEPSLFFGGPVAEEASAAPAKGPGRVATEA